MKPLDPAVRPSRPEFDVHLTEKVPVTMRDGARLATDVYRPARGGRPLVEPRPVLLHRTPYNKTETESALGECRWFAARGYVVVNQDCRGCFHSEGDVNVLVPEAEDGADTIPWIRRQEWSNGTVGAFGTSWSGWTQTAMAALGPDGLAAMVPNMSGADHSTSRARTTPASTSIPIRVSRSGVTAAAWSPTVPSSTSAAGSRRSCCRSSRSSLPTRSAADQGGIMAPLEVHDPGLHDLIAPDAAIERVAGGLWFTEGPVWRSAALLFSDIPNKRIARWRRLHEGPELTTYARGTSNGLTLDRQGRVLAAEHDGRRVTRVTDDGSRTVLAEQFQGKRLNSPNDIVVKSDGAVYFTDPPYGVQPSAPGVPRPAGWWTRPIPGKEQPCNGVYRIAPDGTLQLVVDDFALPNGLAFSPDESVLYIDDSAHKHVRAFDVRPDGTLTNGRILLDMASDDPGVPDGLKVDLSGNVFCTGPGGVWVCRANGALLGRIVLPELPANLAWGEDGRVLFLTARTSVYRLETKTRGALPG